MGNPQQLATMDEAKALAHEIGPIGGGVAEIYVPSYGVYTVPENGDAKFYHFRFNNGQSGYNVGLIRSFKQMFPTRWLFMLATEVNAVNPWAAD